MRQVLLLTPGGRHWWRQDGHRWQAQAAETDGPIWVVTDLAEESLAECKVPRLFGRDRSSFVQRQVAGRYPDTPFRGYMPIQSDDPLSALAPTRFALFGIDAAERINAELDALRGDLAGVWPISMLMGNLAAYRGLPPDLFVVLPGAGTLRIVYLKNRTPVLTRLTLTPNDPRAQVDEIVRTLRHLENTQAVPRDRKAHALLFLGEVERINPLLAPARLLRIDPPRKIADAEGEWLLPLLDLVLRSPVGQVAPLARRVTFQSARVKGIARNLAILVAVVGILAASNNLLGIYRMVQQRIAVSNGIAELDDQIDLVNAQVARFGVSPETLRKAVSLVESELDSVPSMQPHLQMVSQAIGVDPNLRVRELQWRIIPSGAAPCRATTTPGVAATPDPGTGDTRKIEVSFELRIPDSYGPRDRAIALKAVSRELSAIDGLVLLQDANRELATGSLRGGAIISGVSKLGWCMTLPGRVATSKLGVEVGR